MATPYFATEYTSSHLELEPELRSNVSMTYYEGGHMMYADEVCLAQMTADIEGFYAGSWARRSRAPSPTCPAAASGSATCRRRNYTHASYPC